MAQILKFSRDRNSEDSDCRAEAQLRRTEEAGSQALEKFKRHRGKLSHEDRRALARGLYDLIEELKRTGPGFKVGQLAHEAGFSHIRSSKELHRLTLPPNMDPSQRGLRAYTANYARLIEAVQPVSGQNLSLLADRILWASSFHPRKAQDIDESERLFNLLQGYVNRVDDEFRKVSGGFTLYQVFMETARQKVRMVSDGGLLRWPFWDSDGSNYEYPHADPYTPRPEDQLDPRFAYWQRDWADPRWKFSGGFCYPSGLSVDGALTHLPRIYLGVAEQLGGDEDRSDESLYDTRKKASSYVGYIQETRDPHTGDAAFSTRNARTRKWDPGLDTTACNQLWLVMYPSTDHHEIGAMLYLPCGEGDVYVTYLGNSRAFEHLRTYEYFADKGKWVPPARTLYDRVKELMGYGSGLDPETVPILKQWRETAPDLLHNPVLRAYRERSAKDEDFSRLEERFWGDDND